MKQKQEISALRKIDFKENPQELKNYLITATRLSNNGNTKATQLLAFVLVFDMENPTLPIETKVPKAISLLESLIKEDRNTETNQMLLVYCLSIQDNKINEDQIVEIIKKSKTLQNEISSSSQIVKDDIKNVIRAIKEKFKKIINNQ